MKTPDVHIFVMVATPPIQCARQFFHSYLKEMKKINNQFLNGMSKKWIFPSTVRHKTPQKRTFPITNKI